MPITIELEKNPFLRNIVEQVLKECTIENIGMVLHARFGVSLPDDVTGRLRELSQAELDEMITRSATVATAEDAVAVRPKYLPRSDIPLRAKPKKRPRSRRNESVHD